MIGTTPSTPIPHDQNYVFFHIKPFKDNDRGINHRDTIGKNLISLKKKKIIFLISGNSTDIKLFVGIPKDFKNYFENTFYASFPTSDLVECKTPINVPKSREWLLFSKEGKITTKEEFTRDGTYMDPMNGIFALYNLVDASSKLDIYFTYTFKLKKKFLEKLAKIFTRIREPKKKNEEEGNPEKKADIKPELFGSVSYKIYSKDNYLVENLKKNIIAAFAPFISNGKIKIKTREKFHGMLHTQADNFFHIPTMSNFNK